MNPPLAQIFRTLALIIAVARLGGAFFERIGQPSVLGEIVAGIALGPSALGLVAPGMSAAWSRRPWSCSSRWSLRSASSCS